MSLPAVPQTECDWGCIEQWAIESSLDLDIAKRRIFASAAGLRIETIKQVFPQFDAGVASERDEGVWYVGPAFAVAVPFFDFGQAKAAKAQSEIFRLWDDLTALAVEIRSEARLAKIHLMNAHRQSVLDLGPHLALGFVRLNVGCDLLGLAP